jgi:hypothetical protein
MPSRGAVKWRVCISNTEQKSWDYYLPPLQGESSILNCLGLKPQAESFHPFGIIPTDLRDQEATRSGSAQIESLHQGMPGPIAAGAC